MANRQLTEIVYNRLILAYREKPGEHKHAALKSGLNWRTARRGWEIGWAPRIPWAPCIKTIIETEQTEARAKILIEKAQQTVEEAQRVTTVVPALQPKAREDALDSRVQETRVVRLAREFRFGRHGPIVGGERLGGSGGRILKNTQGMKNTC